MLPKEAPIVAALLVARMIIRLIVVAVAVLLLVAASRAVEDHHPALPWVEVHHEVVAVVAVEAVAEDNIWILHNIG